MVSLFSIFEFWNRVLNVNENILAPGCGKASVWFALVLNWIHYSTVNVGGLPKFYMGRKSNPGV